jgi:hypothetical protein
MSVMFAANRRRPDVNDRSLLRVFAVRQQTLCVSGQIDRLAVYMRQAFPREGSQSCGERMAERLATRARPTLAAEPQEVRKTGMAAIDGTTKADEQRRAEFRAITERDGKLAARQDCTLAEP